MKKHVAVLCILLIFVFAPQSLQAAKIDQVDVESFVSGGTTMAKASEAAEALGLTFIAQDGEYLLLSQGDEKEGLCFVKGREDAVFLRAYGLSSAGVPVLEYEEEHALSAPWCMANGALYVPFRYVCEYFGARVSWSEEQGALAQRTAYGRPVLMRTDGTRREMVAMPEDFESAMIAGDKLIYLAGDSFYIQPLSGGDAAYLCPAGRVHVSDGYLFVSSGESVRSIDLETLSQTELFTGAVMVGYTVDGYAWCENSEGEAFVYDGDGTCLAHVTGDLADAFEYKDGFVYYLTDTLELHRARPDGTGDSPLAKSAAYPALIDGGVYYTDMAGNFRRVDVETGEDVMVYGLNLECMKVLHDGTYLFNFYAPKLEQCRMFASAFDGTLFRTYGSAGVILDACPALFREGLCGRSMMDGKLYYVTDEAALCLSEDFAAVFCGVYGDFAYYVLS